MFAVRLFIKRFLDSLSYETLGGFVKNVNPLLQKALNK